MFAEDRACVVPVLHGLLVRDRVGQVKRHLLAHHLAFGRSSAAVK